MFSVGIPVYNHARYLHTAVQSCLASALVKEVLLVDDGSSDASAAVVAELAAAHPRLIRNLSESPPINRGAHARLNQLCGAASQPWVAILNSDDFFPAHRFELAQLLIRSNPCDLLAGAILIVDEQDRVIGTKRGITEPEYPCPLAESLNGPLQTEELRLLLCSQNLIATTSNILFRKSLFEKIGGFADLRYAHDWEFALRATMAGRCLWTPNFLTCYRLHETNTIKEQSTHVDGEIVRFFYRFLADYPQLEADSLLTQALGSNQHLAPYTRTIDVSNPLRPATSGIEELYHFPSGLNKRVRLNALLAIYYFSYDFLLISSDLAELPVVQCESPETALVFRRGSALVLGSTPEVPAQGRFLRIPGKGLAGMRFADISRAPGWSSMSSAGADIAFGMPLSTEKRRTTAALQALGEALNVTDSRPVCLVLPMYMAVGGVERNTVETIRHLRDEYRFVVVTTERLTESQGSLHYQLDDLDVPCFDLAEIGAPEYHLELLATLVELTGPALVWICNGSSWLTGNALQVRRLFAKTPIIDQQVYDTEHGWINVYGSKGIQAFDRFIAINKRIYEKLTRELRIPAHRVDLIYPALSEEKVRERPQTESLPEVLRHYLTTRPSGGRLFVFVGRLTAQKRPLEFLKLAANAARDSADDHFVIVGDGELRADCEVFITENGLQNVTSIPYHPSPPQILGLADGMVITSMFEGLPIAMLEALAVGTPVFSTDVGDIRVILEEYGSGSTVAADSSSSGILAAFTDWRIQLSTYKKNAMATCNQILIRFSAATTASEYRKCFACARANF